MTMTEVKELNNITCAACLHPQLSIPGGACMTGSGDISCFCQGLIHQDPAYWKAMMMTGRVPKGFSYADLEARHQRISDLYLVLQMLYGDALDALTEAADAQAHQQKLLEEARVWRDEMREKLRVSEGWKETFEADASRYATTIAAQKETIKGLENLVAERTRQLNVRESEMKEQHATIERLEEEAAHRDIKIDDLENENRELKNELREIEDYARNGSK